MRSASGYVYNGKLIPELRGKYIFGDITTGRFWYADYKEMLAADADGNAEHAREVLRREVRLGQPERLA